MTKTAKKAAAKTYKDGTIKKKGYYKNGNPWKAVIDGKLVAVKSDGQPRDRNIEGEKNIAKHHKKQADKAGGRKGEVLETALSAPDAKIPDNADGKSYKDVVQAYEGGHVILRDPNQLMKLWNLTDIRHVGQTLQRLGFERVRQKDGKDKIHITANEFTVWKLKGFQAGMNFLDMVKAARCQRL